MDIVLEMLWGKFHSWVFYSQTALQSSFFFACEVCAMRGVYSQAHVVSSCLIAVDHYNHVHVTAVS